MLNKQWYAGKCLIVVPGTNPPQPKKAMTSFAALASFHAVNTSTMADFKVPTWDRLRRTGKRYSVGHCYRVFHNKYVTNENNLKSRDSSTMH